MASKHLLCFCFLLVCCSCYSVASSKDPSLLLTSTQRLSEISFTSILGDTANVHRFMGFIRRYGKHYSTSEELRHRFSTFVENVRLIDSANNKKNRPYTLGLNQFADLTWNEFRESYLRSGQPNCSATKGFHKLKGITSSLPTRRDWREDGIVSAVKSQGHCGSCWTFSTTGALEAAHAQATGQMVLLSEQQLVDCAGEYNNFGCNGGLPSQAFEYIKYTGGLETEAAYPYTAGNGECSFNKKLVGATVYDVVNITAKSEDELKDAVGTVRPVSVAFEVINEFRFYESGIFTSENCDDSPETVNHAVLAVGYDTDESGTSYWIIKNSWGESWGIDGYFYMEMGKNMCGIATCASYPVVPEAVDQSMVQVS